LNQKYTPTIFNAIDDMLDRTGIDHVGIGTDATASCSAATG
jgi:microsomal dipeptidase-like Zn-dependent dipeptidase